jgi:ATP-dependent exoDNAse (exonuclease V) alpha subunit
MTIHKSQGQTLDKAIINIGSKERAAGCTFVAISRLRRLSDGLFIPMSFERLAHIGKSKGLKLRIEEEERLHALAL